MRRFGDAALLVDVEGSAAARALASAITAAGVPGVREVVGGLSSVLVEVDPWSGPAIDLDGLAAWTARLDVTAGAGGAGGAPVEPHTVAVPVAFGGPDTDDVCRSTGCAPDELARLLEAALLRVAAVGFSPGFAYLEGLPPVLAGVGRLARPRPAVPAGSLALAGGLAAIYPQETPGGWRLVGRTGLSLFDPLRPPYSLLSPGDRVRLHAVEAVEAVEVEDASGAADAVGVPAARRAPGAPGAGCGSGERASLRPPPAMAALSVERAGMLDLVQDGGRWGLAALGVPRAGPADPVAHELANRLCGNRPDGAALEVTASGPVLRAEVALHVAVVGDAEVMVDGHHVRPGHVVPLAAGQRLAIGRVAGAARAYLAVAGGIEVPAVLGSRSTDVLAWLGPGPLRAGDVLGAASDQAGPPADHLAIGSIGSTASTGDGAIWPISAAGPAPARPPGNRGPETDPVHRVLQFLPGPHPEWFDDGALELLATTRYAVGPASDRVGLRLEPPSTGAPVGGLGRRSGELASHGVVTGAVQVPPDGLPVVLGPDHATLGGYPALAVVVASDRWIIGQCRPGDTISFEPVEPSAASLALARLHRLVAGAVAGTYPVVAG
ncbi:MAG: carboxyltransferase domain-containing protein [Acidimicrobiales bacterium]